MSEVLLDSLEFIPAHVKPIQHRQSKTFFGSFDVNLVLIIKQKGISGKSKSL